MSITEDSPSAERRKALKEADAANQLRVLGSCPLPKYVDIADRLLEHFQDAVDGRRLDEAYVFGLRFANLCLSGLPQHPEWRRDTGSKARKRLTSQVGDVLCMMDVLKQRMDAEELMKIKAEMIAKQEEEARLKREEDRRKHQQQEALTREQRIRNALEEERAQFLAEQRAQREEELKQKKLVEKKKEELAKKKEAAEKKNDVEKSAMAKLQAMQAQMSAAAENVAVTEKKKNTEKPKSNKAKVLGWGKKKSSPKPTDGKATLQVHTSAVVEEITAVNPQTESTQQPDAPSQQSERKPAKKEKSKKKQNVDVPVKKQESKPASGKDEKKTKIPPHKENKIDETQDTKSTISATPSVKDDSDSTRLVTSKKNRQKIAPLSFAKSKIEAAKSSISALPSIIKQPPTKTTVKDSVVAPSTKTPASHVDMGTTDTILANQHTPRSQKERATIEKLKRAIQIQEDRLEYIEEKQIPSLLEAAKASLKEDNKKEALKCLAHKKRLERQVDTTKAAVFNMETQMFMLESAIEDRHVQKALNEAASAMAGFQQNIGDPNAAVVDLKNMGASLPELDVGDSTDEELMEELEQWLSPEDRRKAQQRKDDDDILLLSMPTFLPSAPIDSPTSLSVDRICDAVLGE